MKRFKLLKLNNKGLSLVELLVAIVILGIVVAPFLHSFLTVAQTNAKSSSTLTATNLAESVMEEFGSASVEELITEYSGVRNGADKTISFEIDGTKFNPNATDYSVSVLLDPDATDTSSKYYGWNNLNVAQIENITSDACAVYAMREDADQAVYNSYALKSKSAASTSPSNYIEKQAAFFASNVTRTIEINIKKGLPILDPETGHTIDNVKISVTLTYELPSTSNKEGSKKVIADSDRKYIVTRDIYDNKSSKVPFSSVYLFFYPIFGANDTVNINNLSDIPCTAYILKESRGEAEIAYSSYKTNINLHETPEWYTGSYVDSNDHSATAVRTNLFKESSTLKTTNKYFNLYYFNNSTQITSSFASSVDKVMEIWNMRTADGRRFDDKASNDRIYKVLVTVKKGEGTEASDVATLTGTKLD